MSDDVGFGAERLTYIGLGLYELIVGLGKLLLFLLVCVCGIFFRRRNTVRGS
ncbi:MAG: hypothetical protein RL681_381 [Candidatus Parcubacteria bacterium]|jgi:hypothetical protein